MSKIILTPSKMSIALLLKNNYNGYVISPSPYAMEKNKTKEQISLPKKSLNLVYASFWCLLK